MLTKLEIINFQSHKHTVLEFHKGVNVVIGDNDVGKTAVFRSLRLVTDNKPSGEKYRSNWGGDTVVSLHTSNGAIVTRERSKRGNLYLLGNDEFRAFKQGVPDEIKMALNLTDVNIQVQHSAPYLLSSTAGEVAGHFNKIAKISVIDTSIAKANSLISKTKQGIKQREEDLKEKIEKHKRYKGLDDLQIKVANLYDKKLHRQEQKVSLSLLTGKSGVLKKLRVQKAKLNRFLSIEPKIKQLKELQNQKAEKESSLATLKNKVEVVEYRDSQIKSFEKEIAQEESIKKLISLDVEAESKAEKKEKLHELIVSAKEKEKRISELIEKIHSLTHSLPEICPLCSGTGKIK